MSKLSAEEWTRREKAAKSMMQAMKGKRRGDWMPSVAAWAVEFGVDQDAFASWMGRYEPKAWRRYVELREGYAAKRRERICKAYAAGEPVDAIAEREGMYPRTVENLARRYDLPRRRPFIDWAALLKQHADKLRDRMESVEMAEILGVMRASLTQAVHRGRVPGWQVIGVRPHAYRHRGCLILGRVK